MIKNCPFCGKAFDVIRPQLWKFKENNVFFCTYTCKRAYDRKEENEMKAISKEQKQQAVRIALDGGDPKPFLAECGSKAPDKLWYYIKNTLKTKDPETYEKLAKAVGMKKQVETPEGEYAKAPTVKVDGQIRIQTNEPEKIEVQRLHELPDVDEKYSPDLFDKYQTVAIRHPNLGVFYYDQKFHCIDWRSDEGDEISLSLQAWSELHKDLPDIFKRLGVEL